MLISYTVFFSSLLSYSPLSSPTLELESYNYLYVSFLHWGCSVTRQRLTLALGPLSDSLPGKGESQPWHMCRALIT